MKTIKKRDENYKTTSMLLLLVFYILAPVITIWCLNGLFSLGIAMTMGNYFMVLIILIIIT